ncbi:hypothetical protein MIR68_007721 [Amoeboaphelidium protococcarum]|nr:hypothetical protein MIR68_007721 [Amoeboaphelidium protococcarum]
MEQVDLSTNSATLKKAYQSVLSSDAITNWVLFTYGSGAQSNALNLHSSGSGGLLDLEDSFESSKIMYAFVRVIDDGADGTGKTSGGGSGMEKFVFISWVGEGVPVQKKALIASHLAAVRTLLKGYHVEIQARTDDDVNPRAIMKKVRDSSGAKYSHQQQDLKHVRKDIADEGPKANAGSNYQRPEIIKASNKIDSSSENNSGSIIANDAAMNSAAIIRAERDAREKELMEREKLAQKERDQQMQKQRQEQDAAQKGMQKQREMEQKQREEAERLAHQQRESEQMQQQQQQRPDAVSSSSTAAVVPDDVSKQARSVKNMWAQREKETKQQELESRSRSGSKSNLSGTPVKKWGSGAVASSRDNLVNQSQDYSSSSASAAPGSIAKKFESMSVNTPSQQQQSVPSNAPPVAKRFGAPTSFQSAAPQVPLRQKSIDSTSQQAQNQDDWNDDSSSSGEALKRQQQEQEQQRLDQERVAREQQEAAEQQRRQQLEEQKRIEQQEREAAEKLRQEQEQQAAAANAHQASTAANTVVALYDYDAAEFNELSLKEGQIVHNVQELDVGWWFGEIMAADGVTVERSGIFPANYVEYIKSDAAPAASHPVVAPAEQPVHNDAAAATAGMTVRALYDYDATEGNEISFKEGDLIQSVQVVTEDWWSGDVAGRVGLFPANYVERV